MAQLAIKGHATRGREVIEILEMLGGKNYSNHSGSRNVLYFIHDTSEILVGFFCYDSDYSVFTLEEFLEKFPYKVGDKVKDARIEDYVGTIIKAQWDDYEEEVVYTVIWDDMHELSYFAKDLQPYKEETMEEKVVSFEILESHCSDEVKIEFDPSKFEMVKRENGYYVVKKQPQYPKTFIECAKILDCFGASHIDGYKNELIEKFQELLICRDAYWKIAGEQLGLGKPWEPEEAKIVYAIFYNFRKDTIDVSVYNLFDNVILCFPTEDMRDAFKENFDKDIEFCKEFL